ncbi:MAG: transglycosylase domain-containing protein, partial [Candidatus Dormibacteria bacterium]
MASIAMRRRRRRRSSLVVRFFSWALALVALAILFALGLVAGIVYAYSRHLPDISRMADFQPSRTTRVYARNGTLLASLYTQNRIYVPIARIPPFVREAFVANEDHNFYTHHGVDPLGIVRAAIADWRHQEFQGASTITQQLARGLFLNDEVSISRKIQEALLAIEIEHYYTKNEILERYLNLIYFGAGAYGIDAAAHTYFGTDVARLSLAQAALLAGLPAAPSDYSPFANLGAAIARQHHVLERMQDSGYLTAAQRRAAERAPLGLIAPRPEGLQSYRYPWFTTYVRHVLDQTFGAKAVDEDGLTVDTTLDPRLEKLAQAAIDWGRTRSLAEGVDAHQGALVAIRPSTGEIVAMVGGAGGFSLADQFNRAWQA